jgi:hypothetical protein
VQEEVTMAVNLESFALPAAAYGQPVTVQDQQGNGHGQQQPAQDTGYSASSAFEQVPGASLAHAQVQDQDATGGNGDLLSKLSGFIRAVGDVVVQLGEYIRSAGGALSDTLAGQPAPQQAVQPAPLGTPAAATAPGAPVPQEVLAGPQANAAATLAAPPRQTNPSLNARPSAPASTDASRSTASAAGVGAPAPDLSAAAASPRGGARSAQSSGYPVLNPLPAYLGDQLGFFNFGSQPEPAAEQAPSQGFEATIGSSGFEGFQGFEATAGDQEPAPEELPQFALQSASARPPVQPISNLASGLDPIAQVQAYENAHLSQLGVANNVIPFPSQPARDPFAGEASNEATGAAAPPELDASPRYSAMVFRPAFYGNLRC